MAFDRSCTLAAGFIYSFRGKSGPLSRPHCFARPTAPFLLPYPSSCRPTFSRIRGCLHSSFERSRPHLRFHLSDDRRRERPLKLQFQQVSQTDDFSFFSGAGVRVGGADGGSRPCWQAVALQLFFREPLLFGVLTQGGCSTNIHSFPSLYIAKGPYAGSQRARRVMHVFAARVK